MKALPKRKGNPVRRREWRRGRGLNESPSEKEGKFRVLLSVIGVFDRGLNESPSEKEGKFLHSITAGQDTSLNESPSEKEGKSTMRILALLQCLASMKALPKRKGNTGPDGCPPATSAAASMKALPKRKGNLQPTLTPGRSTHRLNESPSEKEGKYCL